MKMLRFGSHACGYTVDIDLIPPTSTVIDAGVAEDTTFIEALQKVVDVEVIGIDPRERAKRHVERQIRQGALNSYSFLDGAVSPEGRAVPLYEAPPAKMSRSTFPDHKNSQGASQVVQGVDLKRIIRQPPGVISLVKMDIEGGEYDTLQDCFGVPQIVVEFHHWDIRSLGPNDTCRKVQEVLNAGYGIIWYEGEGRVFNFVRGDLL